MAVLNKILGAPIIISIGGRGEKPDLYPARLAGQPTLTVVNGRPSIFAEVIALQTNSDGEAYLAQRVHNLAFAFDRTERVEPLDGPRTQPKSIQELVAEQGRKALEFAMNRPERVSEMALDDVLDA